jgi:Beta-lactamase class C and other penicillin binding proteins
MRIHHTTELDPDGIERLRAAIRRDLDAGDYDGAVVAIAHRGEVVVDEAFGLSDRVTGRAAATQDVFRILSVTKAFTVALVFHAIDRGLLSLTTNVVEVIPEFRSPDRFMNKVRDRISVMDLLTHRAGLPATPTPVPYDKLGDLAEVIRAVCETGPIGEPGETIEYSPAFNHAILGEMARRVLAPERRYRDLVQEILFEPLGMASTAIGAPARLADRIVPLRASFEPSGWLSPTDIEILNDVVDEEAELPHVGGVSTSGDLLRFAEMLRRGGTLGGTRILSSAILDRATRNHTGDQPNNWWIPMAARRGWKVMPANLGLGVFLRGEGLHPSILGTLTSPRTFGNYGAGSSIYWVDPVRELSFVCLTAGVMEESANIARFQKLSDLVASSVVVPDRYPAL